MAAGCPENGNWLCLAKFTFLGNRVFPVPRHGSAGRSVGTGDEHGWRDASTNRRAAKLLDGVAALSRFEINTIDIFGEL
jgi:hypothetical protein